jgi:protein SCO1/2
MKMPMKPCIELCNLMIGLFALGGLTTVEVARAEEPHERRAAVAQVKSAAARRLASYQVPDVELIRADGARVSLRREIDDGRPVILNFIFTSCTAICPVMTQIFAQIQNRLGEERDKVHMISVSIDPEQDTPARLREYAAQFHAGAQWSFYTGTLENSLSAQKAFDAYRGNKMNHVPVTFLRLAPGRPWVRLEGFTTADDVVLEYRQLLATR